MIYRSYQKPVVVDLKGKGWDDDTIMKFLDYVNKKETLENLIHDKNYQLDKYYEENRDTFECKYQNRFDGFQEKVNHEDKVINKVINTDTELIFWNNM